MAQKQVEEQKFNPEQFISKNHESILKDHNLQLQVRYESGIYKAYVAPLKEGMTDKQIADNLKKSLQEIGNQSKGKVEVQQFNMLMATLVQDADNTTIEKIKSGDQNFLKDKFLSKINVADVVIGGSTNTETTKGEGQSETGRNVYLVTKSELEQWLVEKKISEMKSEGIKATHEDEKQSVWAKKLVDDVKKQKSFTESITTKEGQRIANTLATGAKANEELQKKDVKGVVVIIRDDNVEKNMLNNSSKIAEQLYEKTKITEKDKNKFGTFKDKEGNYVTRMKHANGKWKDSILLDKEGKLNEETLKDLCYVANIYKNDTETKSREKNGLTLEQAKEIRKAITDTIFSIKGVQEAYKEANEKYKNDRKGYELSKDGFAAGYLYEILKQKK